MRAHRGRGDTGGARRFAWRHGTPIKTRNAGTIPSVETQEQRCRSLHFGESRGTAFERHLIATPQFHVPIFVDMGRKPSLVDVERAPEQGECQQR